VTEAPLLKAERVSRAYRPPGRAEVTALAEVSLSVARGEMVAVTGPSGGGKTTLLSVLASVERATAGRVLFDGEDLSALSGAALARVRRRLGIVFQGSPSLRRLPAWENAALPLVPRGVRGPARRERALALLLRLGLADRAESAPETMSAGEAQRLGIARALVSDPDIVIADEPTAHLDSASSDTVAALFAEVLARGGAVVVATHDPALLARATTRHVLAAGRLVGG
jgi:ABC-type lipoprotein export system ATPase subunit